MTDEARGSGRTPGYDPRCKPCNDPYHDEYDKAYFNGEISKSEYSRKVGCSINSVTRHIEGHIPKNLAVATEAQAVTKANNLLDQIGYYEAEARRYKDDAEAKGDINLALKAVDRALKCIEIYARVQGLIHDPTTVNVLINPQWVELRTLIVSALGPYPEARQAVLDAIHE